MVILLHSLSVVVFIVVFGISWRLTGHFLSRSDRYNKSSFDLFKKKIGIAFGFAFIPAYLVSNYATSYEKEVNTAAQQKTIATTPALPIPKAEVPIIDSKPQELMQIASSPQVSTPDINSQQQTQAMSSSQMSSSDVSNPCHDLSKSAQEKLECLDRKYLVADKELNNLYKQIMETADNSMKIELKKVQRAWISEKMKKCNTASMGNTVDGNSGNKLAEISCLVEMTEKRVSFLKEVQRTNKITE